MSAQDSLEHTIRFNSPARQAAAVAFLMCGTRSIFIVDRDAEPYSLHVTTKAFHKLWDADLIDGAAIVTLIDVTKVTQILLDIHAPQA